jgi:hypothetical protein
MVGGAGFLIGERQRGFSCLGQGRRAVGLGVGRTAPASTDHPEGDGILLNQSVLSVLDMMLVQTRVIWIVLLRIVHPISTNKYQ